MLFEEMINIAAGSGLSCVEVAYWPRGKAKRCYARVSHIDIGALTDKEAAWILDYCKVRRVEISSLAYYPNTTDGDPEKRAVNIAYLKQVITVSRRLDVNPATTLVERGQTKTVEENLELFQEIWPSIVREAEGLGAHIAIENCPVLLGPDQ